VNIYPAIYTDKFGSVDTEIVNNFKEGNAGSLRLKINGVQFEGTSFDDFTLLDKNKYSKKELKRFSFVQINVHGSDNYVFSLCNCSLKFSIPVTLYREKSKENIPISLNVYLSLGRALNNGAIEFEEARFNLKFAGKNLEGIGDYFETGFLEIRNKLNGEHILKTVLHVFILIITRLETLFLVQ